MAAPQRLRSVVNTTSMHGHGHEAVIEQALIAHAESPLMHVQRPSHAAGAQKSHERPLAPAANWHNRPIAAV